MTTSDDASAHDARRRKLLKLTAGLAAFGAAMGISENAEAVKTISWSHDDEDPKEIRKKPNQGSGKNKLNAPRGPKTSPGAAPKAKLPK